MSSESEGRALAEQLRQEQQLGLAEISDIPELLESFGIDVMFVPMRQGVHGLTRHNPFTGDTLVAIATGQPPERQRFSLAHELGHIRAGDVNGDFESLHVAHDETRAHAFARHLLAPLDGVRRLANKASGLTLGSDIVRHYQVSPDVASIQMRLIGAPASDVAAVKAATAESLARQFGWAHQRSAALELSNVVRPPRVIVAGARAAFDANALSAAVTARLSREPLADVPVVDEQADDVAEEQRPRENAFEVGNLDW